MSFFLIVTALMFMGLCFWVRKHWVIHHIFSTFHGSSSPNSSGCIPHLFKSFYSAE